MSDRGPRPDPGDPGGDRGRRADRADEGPTNDVLLEALAAFDDDPTRDTHRRMFSELLDAALVVPVAGGQRPVDAGDADLHLDVPMLTTADGRSALPVFSDEEALSRFDDDADHVVIAGRALFPLLAGDPPDLLVLNAAGPIGVELDADELATLAQGRIPEAGPVGADPPTGTEIAIGVPDPDDVPVGLVPAAREALAADPVLVEGYLLTVASPDGSRTQLALGVAFADDPDHEAIRSSFEVVAEHLREHVGEAGIGLFPLADELLERLRGAVEPLYEVG